MDFIPQMEPWFDQAEAQALNDYVLSGGWGTEFRKTEEFENRISEYTGAKHCIATNNGTIAISIALLALGVGEGDEVIVPDLTMIATPNAAVMIGAKPVFVDVEPATLNIDAEQVRLALTDKTKAVVHVSLNGRSSDISALRALCDRNGVALMEDAAQSLGSFRDGKHLGTMGSIGTLSFSSPKVITTGQGGALLTNETEIADRIKKLKDFGRISGGNDVHDEIGYNFKFTDFQAVVGVEQMKKLPWRVERKKEIWRRYRENLADLTFVQWLETDLSDVSPWFIDIYVDRRDDLSDHLRACNIGSRPIYPPIHLQQAYNQTDRHFPVTEDFSSRGIWLPSASKLTDSQIDQISDAIRSFFSA